MGEAIDDHEFRWIDMLEGHVIPDPRFIEGATLFPAPWRAESVVDANRRVWWMVLAANGRTIINPVLAHSEEFCRAVAAARNEVTDAECLAAMEARMNARIAGAQAEVERVRAHFQAVNGKLHEANERLQDAIVRAIASGSVDDLPRWCQPSDGESFGLVRAPARKRKPVRPEAPAHAE